MVAEHEVEELLTEPYQPNPKNMPVQKLPNKTLHFQDKWFREFPWLHYSQTLNGVLCFYCAETFKREKSNPVSKHVEEAFVSAGFRNWKKASEKFKDHAASRGHNLAIVSHRQQANPVSSQLSAALATSQEKARSCLIKIVTSLKYLGRQGLALRGNEADEGNFFELLKLRSADDTGLGEWVKTQAYTSPLIQNEILSMMSQSIIRTIASDIRKQPQLQYSVNVDGTQDITGTEQESVCLRYVDKNLVPHEEFVGLYEMTGTTGKELANMIKDVLLRLNLSLDGLRGQTYDGAANMSGKYSGAQVYLSQEQPLALYVHCGPHCVNLITQAACEASPVIRDALQWVHELGRLFGISGKFKTIFKSIATSDTGSFH